MRRGSQGVKECLELLRGHVLVGAADLAPILILQQGGGGALAEALQGISMAVIAMMWGT